MSLRTLYDEASLWMTPGGYEDGKLFSELPTDGSGDFTFSRGSNLAATRVGPTGLIEKGRENTFTYSDMTSGISLDGITRTTGYADPFGGNNAIKITENTSLSNHRWYKLSATLTGVYTASFYAKYDTRKYVRVFTANQNATIDYNLIDGTIDYSASNIDSTMVSVGGGWYRCSVSVNGTASNWIGIYLLNDSRSNNYTGDGTSSALLYGFQLEQGLVATDYIETGASTAQAGILEDMPRLDYSGGASCPALLLEPQRTNVLPQSEYFGGSEWTKTNTAVTTNAATSPEGVQNASLVYPTASSSTRWDVMIQEFITGLVSANYVNTFYLKSNGWRWVYIIDPSGAKNVWFDLQEGVLGTQESNATGEIQAMGDGWYKCVVYPHTSPTTYVYAGVFFSDADNSYVCTPNGTSGAYVYGSQSEAGSYPTSYIPTYGSSVTRDKDYPSLTGASGLIGQEQGTIVFDFKRTFKNDNYNRYLIVDDNDSSAYRTGIFILPEPSNDGRLYINVRNNATSVFAHTYNDTTNRDLKIAVSYSSGDIDYFVNGVKVNSSNTTFSFSHTLERIAINGSNQENNQTLVFKTKLTDSECIALTTL